MSTVTVPRAPRPEVRLTLGIALLGALVVLSPYVWLDSWRGFGFSPDYLWFHVWCWVPFALLATVARRRGGIGRRTSVLLAGLAIGRLVGVGELDRVQTFLLLGTSIAVEALPFVLLGAGVSAAIEVFVPERWFTAISRLPLPLQIPGVALAGLAMPVCECGSVPVARRLIVRGVHPAAGIAFMLAAPVINPIVLLSTAVAYQGRGALEMVLGRAALGLIVALVAGTLIARMGVGRLVENARTHDPAHAHDHSGGRVRGFVDHLAADLLLMGKFIVLGAAIAAAMQTIVPQSVFTGVLTSPFVGALLMIVLAFFLSLCSEADAFVHRPRGQERELRSERELDERDRPILLALMVPAPSLGAQAVKNKRTKNPPAPIDAPIDGEIRLYEIAWAGDSAEYAEMNRSRPAPRSSSSASSPTSSPAANSSSRASTSTAAPPTGRPSASG